MGKAAAERRKRIMQEVRERDKQPHKNSNRFRLNQQERERFAAMREEQQAEVARASRREIRLIESRITGLCCLDKHKTLPDNFVVCHGCPKGLTDAA